MNSLVSDSVWSGRGRCSSARQATSSQPPATISSRAAASRATLPASCSARRRICAPAACARARRSSGGRIPVGVHMSGVHLCAMSARPRRGHASCAPLRVTCPNCCAWSAPETLMRICSATPTVNVAALTSPGCRASGMPRCSAAAHQRRALRSASPSGPSQNSAAASSRSAGEGARSAVSISRMHFTIVGRSVAPGLMSVAVAARTRRRAFGASAPAPAMTGARATDARARRSRVPASRAVWRGRRFRRGNEEKREQS